MIIVKLIGGLGNQMFQYACGRNLSLRRQTELKFDVEDLERGVGITPRVYSLDCFGIDKKIADQREIKKLKNNHWLNKFGINLKKGYFKEKAVLKFDEDIFKTGQSLYLDGYWQSVKYFKENQATIRQDFQLKPGLVAGCDELQLLMRSTDSVAIHIRRGDYVNNPEVSRIHNCCTDNYYKSAVDLLANKLARPHFFIFSDDIDWARNNFKLRHPTNYVSDPKHKDWQELMLMSLCKHQIIANSSFSWWGAWLNVYPDKNIVAPKKWFNTQGPGEPQDIVPGSWIRI